MWIWYLLAIIILIAGTAYFWQNIQPEINTRRNLSQLGKEARTLTQDGITFRDLNKNGKLDPYEDPRRPIEERVEDLLKQMTFELPSSMDAVRKQKEDVPHDSENPLFPFGHGLSY